jgi:hypothetical protein
MDRVALTMQLARKAGISAEEAVRVVEALFDPAQGILAGRSAAGGPVRVTGFQRFEPSRGPVGPMLEYEVWMRERGSAEAGPWAGTIAAPADAGGEAMATLDVDVPGPAEADPGPAAPDDAEGAVPGFGRDVSRGYGGADEGQANAPDPSDIGGAAMDVHGSGDGGRD